MKAFIIKKFAFVWRPAIKFDQGIYEYYIFPTLQYTNNKEKKFKCLTVFWWSWAIISIIKTV